MTKQLIILRHGQATSGHGLSDIDRSLKDKGIIDAYKMAESLQNRNINPEQIISSNAARALHTATIFARTLNLDSSKVNINNNLYLADIYTILDTVCKTEDHINSLLIVGHNPGLSDLVSFLLNKENINLPTSGMVWLQFEAQYWPDLLNVRPSESFFEYPT